MQIVILPPLEFVEGYPFDWMMTWSDEATGLPVDFTEVINGNSWSGRFTIATTLDDAPSYEAVPTLTADGQVIIAMTPDQFAFLTPPSQIGGGVVAVFQIQLSSPVPNMSQVFQGPVRISGVI